MKPRRTWKRILFGITCALLLFAPKAGHADEESGITVRWQNGFRDLANGRAVILSGHWHNATKSQAPDRRRSKSMAVTIAP